MDPEPASSPEQDPTRGLPPVTPPSGRHIVQLFVVPAAIVLTVIFVGWGITRFAGWMVGASDGWGLGYSDSPRDYLARLASANPDIRWRAANDLAQVLKRDEKLASNPELVQKLADLLNRELDDFDKDEQALNERSGRMSTEEQKREQSNLKRRREYIRFLSASLGNASLPEAAAPLIRMARRDRGGDPRTTAFLRRHAVWMLANLGENLKQHGQKQADLGVIDALAECGRADDVDLRLMTAFALTFWAGSARENALAEQTLATLSTDDGHGTRMALGEDE